MLLEFRSVVDAVEFAVAVQTVMDQRNEGVPADRRMLFRIGKVGVTARDTPPTEGRLR